MLGRPAPKGVDWRLGAPTAEWDRVYGELLPSWERARIARDAHARSGRAQGTGAEAQVLTRARSREMLAVARAQPDGEDAAAALATLAAQVDDLELSGRAFGRLVAEANDAARRAGLAYYLDAAVNLSVSADGAARRFYTTPYRVKEVHAYRVGDDRFGDAPRGADDGRAPCPPRLLARPGSLRARPRLRGPVLCRAVR